MAYGAEQASSTHPEILTHSAWAGWWTDIHETPPLAPLQGPPAGSTAAAASRP